MFSGGYADALCNGRTPQREGAAGDIIHVLECQAGVTTGDVTKARRLLGSQIRLDVAEGLEPECICLRWDSSKRNPL